jgi:hypothetical protein
MSKGQWAFRPAVLTRAIKAAEKSGKNVVGAEIDSVTGKFELTFQKSSASPAEAAGEPLVIPEKLWPAAKVQQQARMEIDAWVDVLGARLAVRTIKGATIDGRFAVAADANGKGRGSIPCAIATTLACCLDQPFHFRLG